ncbi:MAG: 2-succinyl-5-enolpyruvyl-6-hydroxy-3-cyclohexene-1-carboxylate synthase, partial [Candidatus Omnitrophica bacterium]|nr:2-succinyl-5-enolpyruvyl-6-hydroxy-3-cyclohexene-1-carboxylate synthase [Candidatus Omnitrophota bacterium]
PVHVNWMFREPFATNAEPVGEEGGFSAAFTRWTRSRTPWTTYFKPRTAPDPQAVRLVGEELNAAKDGIIVVGKLSGPAAARHVIRLAEKLQWPVFADITSGLRFASKSRVLISHFDQILAHIPARPEMILHLGGRMTSKRYYQWIDQNRPAIYAMVLNHPLRNDPGHQVTHRVQSCPGAFAQKVAAIIPQKKSAKLLRDFRLYDDKIRAFLTARFADQLELSEPAVVSRLSRLIPKTNALFLANSLPIREFDMFADHRAVRIPVSANRGASGIDGIISSAAGFSQGLDKAVTLLIGDLAFLYDINALSMLARLNKPMITIVLNNDGGGIFEFLPVSSNAGVFEEFFAAPHGYRFEDSARQFR